VPVTGGEPERLTRGPLDKFRGALSPNGKELVYHAFRSGSRNMFLQSLDGGPAQQLTLSAGSRSMANWSPDGNALALFDIEWSQVLVMRRGTRWRSSRSTPGPE
jgi:Tol biopolymer transport system component